MPRPQTLEPLEPRHPTPSTERPVPRQAGDVQQASATPALPRTFHEDMSMKASGDGGECRGSRESEVLHSCINTSHETGQGLVKSRHREKLENSLF